MAYLLSYTRLPVDSVIYDPRLAYSMHLAISEDGENYQALNHKSGMKVSQVTLLSSLLTVGRVPRPVAEGYHLSPILVRVI